VKLPLLCRVGHVCATCFMEFNWAFRLLWLHCFKPQKHQFAGQVNAVFSVKDSRLYRVRPMFQSALRVCPKTSCASGRQCPNAHSKVELEYWRAVQRGVCTHIHMYVHVIVVTYVRQSLTTPCYS